MTPCRLCHIPAEDFVTVDAVSYLKCSTCGLRFMAEDHLPDRGQEKAHYDHHENDGDDQGYRDFLSRLLDPLMAALPQKAELLDFGAGPTVAGKPPALASMLKERGYQADIYDPIYHDDQTCLSRGYDAITATEVIEHFHDPRAMFDGLYEMLRPKGYLAVMTLLQDDDDAFPSWHYRRDPTHVAFYREETFDWIAAHYGYALERPHRNVAFFRKL